MKDKILLFACILLFFHNTGISQILFPAQITEQTFIEKYDSLEIIFKENKKIPQEYKKQFLLALSAYPEFKNTEIEIRNGKIKTTMACRPRVISLIFNTKEKRKYIIIINSDKKKTEIFFSKLSFNSQIGIIGHELAHILNFSKKSSCTIFADAILYSNLKKREKFEKNTDNSAIERGFGMQLYDFAYFIQYQSDTTEKYKEYKRKIYYTPEEILKILNNSGINFEK